MKKIAVDIQSVSYSRFEQKILDDLTIGFFESEFVILVGPNGSGKSTLMKILNGQIKPTTGQVIIDDKIVNNWPVHKIAHDVATLTQDLRNSTFSELSVLVNMELALGRSKVKIDDLPRYLASFNESLADRIHIPASHLSGGQRQSLALAMCFAHTPKLLLLDEHTSALDPKAANFLMERTSSHVREKQLTTVMITHSIEHAMTYGDRLIALAEGKMVVDLRGEDKKNLTRGQLISLAY